jgi:hypothetical protein
MIANGENAVDLEARCLELEASLKGCRQRVEKAITWLVTVKADQPAGIIADRARLALEALRGA